MNDNNKIKSKINPSFDSDINKTNNNFLFGENFSELGNMETDIPCMLINGKKKELKNIYKLINNHHENLRVIVNSFLSYIRKRGEEIYQNKEISKDPDSLVEDCF